MNVFGPDRVVLDMPRERFDSLLLALGYATGAAMSEDAKLTRSFFRLLNAINEGNPHFTPYAVDDEPKP